MPVTYRFQKSVVGAIPEDWRLEPLGGLAAFVTSGSRGWARFYAESGALFIRSQNVREGRLSLLDVQHVHPPSGAEGDRTKVVANDLLITITGNSVGNVAVVDQPVDEAYVSQHVALARLSDSSAAGYVCRYLSPGSPGNPQIAGSQSGQSKPGLKLHDVREFLIAFPPTSGERFAIAAALSDIDALLDGLDRLIAKKRDLKQAAMQQLLTGQTRIGNSQSQWPVKQLGELFKFSGGYSASRAQLSTSGHCYLHYGDIHGSSKTTIDTRTDFDDVPTKLDIPLSRVSRESLLEDGDVAFVDASEDDAGTSKHVVVVNREHRPFIAGLHTIVAKAKTRELEQAYRRYCFQTSAIRQQFMFYAVGTKVSGISKRNIARLLLPVPPISEQLAIAAALSDMDAELSALEARRDKTRALKQGMMQELLTGKTRLV